MRKPASFPDLLAHWTTLELSADLGVPYLNARKMRERKSVGTDHWSALIKAARRKGIRLTHEELIEMRKQRVAA